MTDKKPKRRAWFQLHLSTCVVMMVVAGAMLGLNMRPIQILESRCEFETQWTLTVRCPGFPGDIWRGTVCGSPTPEAALENFLNDGKIVRGGRYDNLWPCLVVLSLAALACQFLIRRRDRKRATQDPAQ